MAISTIGVGSGLPLEQLLSDLRKGENQALTVIQSRHDQAEHRLSAYSTLRNALESLQSAATTLSRPDTYSAIKTSVTDDAYTATAKAGAMAGDYSIQVNSLATSQTFVTQGMADRTQAIGTGGIIHITRNDGSTASLDLSSTGTTLENIVNAINHDKDFGFNATLLNDGDATAPHRLLLTARNTGTQAGASSITVSDNSALQQLLGYSTTHPDPQQTLSVQEGTDAVLTINTITLTKPSNTITDAIDGVTLNLSKTSQDNSTLSLRADDSVTSGAVTQFVTAYNALQTTLRTLTSFDVENQTASALTGDNLARRLQTEVRNALNSVLSDGQLQSFFDLGISTNVNNGTLDIDEDTLVAALQNSMTDVQAMFSGENGVAHRTLAVVDTFNRSDGLIDMTTQGISRTLVELEKQYAVTQDRINTKIDNYRSQFTALDAMVAQMNSVSSYLTQQLAMLSNLGDDK